MAWARSALFRAYLARFIVLWIAAKTANAVSAILLRLPPLAFRPATELVTCAIELLVMAIFIRRAHEDILLGNVGLPLGTALLPLVPVHFFLSAALALLS